MDIRSQLFRVAGLEGVWRLGPYGLCPVTGVQNLLLLLVWGLSLCEPLGQPSICLPRELSLFS